jgi:hypothetical protein
MEYQQYIQLADKALHYYNNNVDKEEEEDDTTLITGIRQTPTPKFGKMLGAKLGGQIINPIKPTLKEIPQEAKELAELVKISAVWDKLGKEEALKRLATTKKGYTIDPELSNADYITFITPQDKVIVAFRGTNPKGKIKRGIGKGALEPLQWINVATGTEQIYEQHKLSPLKNRLIEKYGINKIEKITGYSMGATKAHRLADELGVESTLFNPFLGKKFFASPMSPNVKHKIYRTTEDVATLQALFTQGKILPKNVNVDSIDPVITVKKDASKITKGLRGRDIYNALYNHNLEHFTQEGDRNNLTREINEKIQVKTQQFDIETAGLDKSSVEYKTRFNKFTTELQPDMRLLSQDLDLNLTPTTKFFKSLSKSNVVRALSGATGALAADSLINSIEQATGIEVDEHINSAISGGLGGVSQATTDKFLGFNKSLVRALPKAIAGGVVGAVAQEATAESIQTALEDAGASAEVAEITSQTIGGGVGGIATLATEQVGALIARQLAVRLGIRLTATAAVEAAAVSAGLTTASVLGGLATGGIAFLIGAAVSAGFAIYDVESRKNAPINDDEISFLNDVSPFLASGMEIDKVLEGIDDNLEKERLRRFIEDPEYQERIRIEGNRQSETQKQERLFGADLQTINRITDFVERTIPDYDNLTNKQRNEEFAKLSIDPQYGNFFSTLDHAIIWDETDEFNDPNAHSFFTPLVSVQHRARARERLINEIQNNPPSEVEPVSEAVEKPVEPPTEPIEIKLPTTSYQNYVLNTINLDPKIQELMAEGDAHGFNKRIREMYKQNQSQKDFEEVYVYGDSTMPQITPKGELVYQKYTDEAPTTQQAKQQITKQ